MKKYIILDNMNHYLYGFGLYVNGFNHDIMDCYYYAHDDFGNLIFIL